MHNELLYDRKIPAIGEENPEHKAVLRWVGDNKKVLETACHTGYFSALLKRQGCDVIGAEIYEPALEKAKPYLSRAISGNIEDEKVWSEISSEKYDVVLYMHILEHLVNPEEILEKTKDILNPNGFVIICLPNVSNWQDRWNMFRGKFNYTETGVMDRTHLKFYNYNSSIELIKKCSFEPIEYCGDSWKVTFRISSKLNRFGNINKRYNRFIHRHFKPNITDKVLMWKIALKK